MEVLRRSFAVRAFTSDACRSAARYLSTSTADVPAGHHGSDLSSTACHIGLNRRRDITLRHDIVVEISGKRCSLPDVFKGRNTVVVGLPDAGLVCKEKHSPDFLKQVDTFKAKGFSQVLLTCVASSEKMAEFAKSVGCDQSAVKVMADPSGSFTRMMALDLNEPGSSPPFSQRYVGLVDQDGILVRLAVEGGPGIVEVSSAASTLSLIAGLSCK